MSGSNGFLLVVCGPPCSGKSFLHDALKSSRTDIQYYEMDDIRLRILKGPLNDKPRRSAAYRVMHHLATVDLLNGRSVAVGATYLPAEQRAELASIAQRSRVDLFVVQCICSPEEAVKRFQRRSSTHAGSDLTAVRVKELTEQYERFDGALLINTDSPSDHVGAVEAYINGETPVDAIQWARHDYQRRSEPKKFGPTASGTENLPVKLSESSVRAARKVTRRYLYLSIGVTIFIGVGILPVLYKVGWAIIPSTVSSWPNHGTWSNKSVEVLSSVFWRLVDQVQIHSFVDIASLATFCFVIAGLGSLLIEHRQQVKHATSEARRIYSAGQTPRYSSFPTGIPSDTELYHLYRCRLPENQKERMPLIDVPLFFEALPSRALSFSTKVTGIKDPEDSSLPGDAAQFGMDWNGFVQWRKMVRRNEYPLTYSHEYGIKCVGLSVDHTKELCQLDGAKCTYDEYVSKELAVNLLSPGTLPDLRRLLEGATWDSENRLSMDIAESARRYSMRLSVTGLVLTADDYFVLQRRSGAVGHGLGSLAGAVNGAADFYSDRVGVCRVWGWLIGKLFAHLPNWLYDPPNWVQKGIDCVELPISLLQRITTMIPFTFLKWDLRKSALREIKEEIGLRRWHFWRLKNKEVGSPPVRKPFLGAAYNLRYGRDLNFYCCFRTKLQSQEISNRRKWARDAWEVESLVFLHGDLVTVKSIESGALDRLLPERARHLLGALYCWAIYAGQTGGEQKEGI